MAERAPDQDRLNGIAQRKLDTLSVKTWKATDGKRLIGELIPGQQNPLSHPLTNEPVTRIEFQVQGHDHFRFLSPPVVAQLPPMQFFEFKEQARIFDQLHLDLQALVKKARKLQARFQEADIEAEIDPGSVKVKARVELSGTGTVCLEGDDQEIVATSLLAAGGQGHSKSLKRLPFNLDSIADSTDLEIGLLSLVMKAERMPDEPQETEEPEKPVRRALTLRRIIRLLGQEAELSPGTTIQRGLDLAGTPAHFMIRLEDEETLSGELVSSRGVVWSGRVKLADFPGVEAFARAKLGIEDHTPYGSEVEDSDPEPASPRQSAPEQAPLSATLLSSGKALPVSGEVWVMNIVIQKDNGKQVHYLCTDVDDQPIGSPHVLPKNVFQKVFATVSPGVFRLAVEVDRVKSGKVFYFQLGPNKKRVGKTQSSELAPFLSNFIPEAAAY